MSPKTVSTSVGVGRKAERRRFLRISPGIAIILRSRVPPRVRLPILLLLRPDHRPHEQQEHDHRRVFDHRTCSTSSSVRDIGVVLHFHSHFLVSMSSLTLVPFLHHIFLANFALIRRSGSFGNSYWRNIEVYGHLFRRYEKGLSLGEIFGRNFPLPREREFLFQLNFVVLEANDPISVACVNVYDCEKMKIQEFAEKSMPYCV